MLICVHDNLTYNQSDELLVDHTQTARQQCMHTCTYISDGFVASLGFNGTFSTNMLLCAYNTQFVHFIII